MKMRKFKLYNKKDNRENHLNLIGIAGLGHWDLGEITCCSIQARTACEERVGELNASIRRRLGGAAKVGNASNRSSLNQLATAEAGLGTATQRWCGSRTGLAEGGWRGRRREQRDRILFFPVQRGRQRWVDRSGPWVFSSVGGWAFFWELSGWAFQ
jgi:hypothetical protein